jgi:ubiquitin C-terminal hydrolase
MSTPPSGLKNIGNTCYFNSGLQSIAPIKPLSDYFQNVQSTNSLVVLLSKYFQLNGTSDVLDPSSIVAQFWKAVPFFSGYTQQDANDMLIYLIDIIHEDQKGEKLISESLPTDIAKTITEITISNITEDIEKNIKKDGRVLTDLTKEDLENQIQEKIPKFYNSIISDLFRGYLLSETTCKKCNTVSRAIDPIYQLSLAIPPPNAGEKKKASMWSGIGWSWWKLMDVFNSIIEFSPVELDECFRQFIKPENLEGSNQYYCKTCKSREDATKKLTVTLHPQVLIIHLKRFHQYTSSYFTKTNVMVNFSSVNTFNGQEYELLSVIVHHGTFGGGHYTCYVKYDGVWYNCDDHYVRKCTIEDVLGSQAYVLIYQIKPSL